MQDESHIPLLKDVVDPDQIILNDDKEPAVIPDLSDPQEIIAVIREGIAAQLNEELQPVISAAINSAVEQATLEIRQLMLNELQGSLPNRMRLLIDEALDKQFGK